MRVVVIGATGFVGRALLAELARRGHAAVAASRDPARAARELGVATCASEGEGLVAALAAADAVVNLAGDPIFEGRWTDEKKRRIRDSRVGATRSLVESLASVDAARRPRVLVNTSAIGWYGETGESTVDETSRAPGGDFLARVCVDWEIAARHAEPLGVRVVLPRFGIVLDRGGGALKPLEMAFKSFVGAPLGPGANWVSWIHRDDLATLLADMVEQERHVGPVNAVTAEPVRQIELCRALARVLRRPCWPGVPRPIVRVVFGEKGEAMMASSRVAPALLERLGWRPRHATVSAALADIYARA